MAHLDHTEAFEELKGRVLDGIKEHFPLKGRLQTLELESLSVKDEAMHADDIRSQHKAKMEGKTWAAPVYANMKLVNNTTGDVIDRKKVRVGDVPMSTKRYSYIVNGQEFQVDNQWQLKPGVYTMHGQSGDLQSKFNVPNKPSFDVVLDPETKQFMMSRGKAKKIPVYPLLKSMGVDDDTLERQWGKEVLAANQGANAAQALAKFYKADKRRAPKSAEEAENYLIDTMTQSELRPDSTEVTLGKRFDFVEGDTFVRATTKMLNVLQNKAEPDDRDSLVFKDLRSVGDYAHDKLTSPQTKRAIRNKMLRQINQADGVRDIVRTDTFNKPLMSTFTSNSAVNAAAQVNPVEMISASMRTTLMGPGGIQSARSIVGEAKLVNKSHLGFLDPLHTPESEKTGVTLHLPVGVKKNGRDAQVPVYNMKTGKTERLSAHEFMASNVAMPDQVTWEGGKPKFLKSEVKMARADNELGVGKKEEVQYVMRHPSQMFSLTSNLIPFMGNTSGNRASYATHHIEQAISLVDREPPLVQSATGSDGEGLRSFEELLGRHTSHIAPVDGQVVSVGKSGITVQGKDGKKREVQLYNNYPLNDPKSVLHSEALKNIKPGTKVKKGQALADTNYTKDGKLALGTNLTVAYLPYKGYNFEDGVVISESAAKKLSSIHMHKPSLVVDKDTVTDPKKFARQHVEAFTSEQYKLLDDTGAVKKGARVKPGDPLVLATKAYTLRDKTGASAIRKSLSGAHTNASLRWDSDHEGEVVAVHRGKKGEVSVHVRTVEPMQIGDKLSGRYGNKGIVTKILEDKDMPHIKGKKEHVEVALNPAGVPGRMNVGQALETAAAKIAKKTGKTYFVENFGKDEDMLQKVQKDLKDNGLTDTEDLVDPTTGMSLGKALMGPQHMLKLTHQVDKKISARAGMALPGGPPEKYDFNLMPSSGGKTGGQSMGNLGMYTMLAHGASANIREIQTWKSEGPDSAADNKRWRSQHEDVWKAIQTGDPLPVPKHTFAFEKFNSMLKAAGINVTKKGNQMQLTPLTDEQVLGMSSGELRKPSALTTAKLNAEGDPSPVKGGLFDEKVTGGHGGKKWSHFKLAEPMPNPVFEKAIQRVLGLTQSQYGDLVLGEKAIDPATGDYVDLGKEGSLTGGPAVSHMLGKLDVGAELTAAKKALSEVKIKGSLAHGSKGQALSTPKLDQAVKKVKYLAALDEAGMSAKDAYVINNVPVLPPAMRPASVLPDGSVKWADLNGLYAELASLSEQMKDPRFKDSLSDKVKKESRAGLYDGVKALMGVGMSYADRQDQNKGLLLQVAGKSPKSGYFQKTLLSRRQDMSMRSTIVPEPAMGLDDVGLPSTKALTLFRPFVVKKLQDIGMARTPLDAQKLLDNKKAGKSKHVLRALDLVMEERPVMMKRDPALHKHSVQAFNAHRVPGRAIRIHPLVTNGYNADFDGDSVDLDTPILLRVKGELCQMTGREMEKEFSPGDGNYTLVMKDVETLTYSGWSAVKTVSFHEVRDKKKYKITLRNGVNFTVSEDHSLMKGKEKLKPVDVRIGMELDHQSFAHDDGAQEMDNYDYEQGVLYGHFFGDGSVDERRVSLACKPRLERSYLKHLWEVHHNVHVYDSDYGYLQISSVGLAADVFRLCGRYCTGKSISRELLQKETAFLKGMLAGYILADGSVEVTKSGSFLIRTWSKSKRLRDDMSLVAHMLGLSHSLRERVKGDVTHYLISFGKESIKEIDYRCKGKKGDLIRHARDEYRNNRNDNRRSQSERGYEVKSLEEVEYDERMVDLEVEGDHVFAIQGGVILHNTMSVYVPIHPDAVKEAKEMMPSKNLFNEATGRVSAVPTMESALGLYKLSLAKGEGKRRMKSPAELLGAVEKGKLPIDEVVDVQGVGKTTAGRIMLSSALPEGSAMQKKILTDIKTPLDKKGLPALYETLAHKHTDDFGSVANKLKDLGFDTAYGAVKIPNPKLKGAELVLANEDQKKNFRYLPVGTHTLSLDDLTPDKKTRDRVVDQTQRRVDMINRSSMSKGAKEVRAVEEWTKATADINKAHHKKAAKNPDNLFLMLQAGVKPKTEQYQQLKLAPMLMQDSTGRTLPTPVTKSYAEGLDVSGYWTQTHGARKGSVQKVQEVQEPGFFSKQLINTTLDLQVNGRDCGTDRGVGLAIDSKDVYDRELAAPIKVKGKSFAAGTLLAPDVVGQIRAADPSAQVTVRSALKCEHGKGLCQKCAGLAPTGKSYDLGTNLGIMAAQSLGERAVQLTLKSFHTGGVAGAGGQVLGSFDRVKALTELPRKVPHSAALSMKSGKVEKIEHNKTGSDVWVGGQKHFVPLDRGGRRLTDAVPLLQKLEGAKDWTGLKVGQQVSAGQTLSDPNRSLVNPHDLYRATRNIEKVQNHLTNELHGIFSQEGVRRQHVETVVKGMSNLTRVRDPGDSSSVLRGEYQPLSQIRAKNRRMVKQGRKPIINEPILKGINVLPLEVQDDWLAKLNFQRLRQTLSQGASTGAKSDLHGTNPIPGMAYGAEFGMNVKHKGVHPHLKDVPEFGN